MALSVFHGFFWEDHGDAPIPELARAVTRISAPRFRVRFHSGPARVVHDRSWPTGS